MIGRIKTRTMDIDVLRRDQIRLHNLTKADLPYTFYHDETNNCRKLSLRADGFNVTELKVFVLGGVVHDGPPRAFDMAGLRTDMRIPANVPELALEYVGKGNFLEILGSWKLTVFLKWLRANNLILHYLALDPMFWSVIDVIDAIVPEMNNPLLLMHNGVIKGDLTEVLRQDLKSTGQLFHRFGYPGTDPQKHRALLSELLDVLERSEGLLEHFHHYTLKGVLQAGVKLSPLDFSVGETPNLLIGSFVAFYATRLAVFRNAQHVLDMEKQIRQQLMKSPLTSGGVPATHYRFADSKAEYGIQLSDVLVGLFGKLFTYFTQTSEEAVLYDRANLHGVALENAILLEGLVSASHDANIAFLHQVVSGRDHQKLDLFLRFDK